MIPMQSTLPSYYPAAAGCGPRPTVAQALTQPGLSGLRLMQNVTCPSGLGQLDALSSGVVVAVGLGLVLAAGWLSYQAGSAMSPNSAAAKRWGWIGVPVGLLTGAPGLGVMGWISNSR